jgi:hypothetical protein
LTAGALLPALFALYDIRETWIWRGSGVLFALPMLSLQVTYPRQASAWDIKGRALGELEPVNDPRFPDVVRRHLHPYSISHSQTNIPLSHLPRDMGENKMLIGKFHPKHCPREDSGNPSFNDDCALSGHDV